MKKIYIAILLCGILQSCGTDNKADATFLANQKTIDSLRNVILNLNINIDQPVATPIEDSNYLYYYVDVMNEKDKGYFVARGKFYQKGDITSFDADDDDNTQEVIRVTSEGILIKN